jgi:hypothetical protein|tara:strand:+ start:42472 stop:43338 length:867 start_codon:yes stop_codon:yes gene_type:complete
MKIINLKITAASPNIGPFKITDDLGNILGDNVSLSSLVQGIAYSVENEVSVVTLESSGDCNFKKQFTVDNQVSNEEYIDATFRPLRTGCLWTHLRNDTLYNYYYGDIAPYIIEYPFAYKYNDQILQNIRDYSKVYTYIPSTLGEFDSNSKIQTDDKYFNKAVLYNGQQSTGILELVPKPMNNLSSYLQYPILNTDSKTITFSKTDSFYQYNTFWALQKNDQVPLFKTSCESKSIDKVVNQDNMNYGDLSFKKSQLRAKNVKVRHILDNTSTSHIVSQFIVAPAQISYH